MDFLGTAANVAQVLGLNNVKSVFAVLTLTLLWQAGSAFWALMNWRMFTLSAGFKFVLWVILLICSSAAFYYFIQRPENLVRNANLAHNTNYWGTGYIETLVTNGNFPADFTKQYPLVLSGKADAIGRRDTAVYPPRGYASFFIEHRSGNGDHVWSSFSQVITGLKQDTDYIAAFKIKADYAEKNSVFLTLDTKWSKPHRYADPGQYDWRRVELTPFNTGKRDFVEFRFVIQDHAKVWLADFELYERPKP